MSSGPTPTPLSVPTLSLVTATPTVFKVSLQGVNIITMFEREGYLLVLLYFVEEDMMDYLFESMSPILVLTELVVTPIRNFSPHFRALFFAVNIGAMLFAHAVCGSVQYGGVNLVSTLQSFRI